MRTETGAPSCCERHHSTPSARWQHDRGTSGAVSGGLLACLPLEPKLRGRVDDPESPCADLCVDRWSVPGMTLEQAITEARRLDEERQQSRVRLHRAGRGGTPRLRQWRVRGTGRDGPSVVEEFFPDDRGTAAKTYGAPPKGLQRAVSERSPSPALVRRTEARSTRSEDEGANCGPFAFVARGGSIHHRQGHRNGTRSIARQPVVRERVSRGATRRQCGRDHRGGKGCRGPEDAARGIVHGSAGIREVLSGQASGPEREKFSQRSSWTRATG